MKRLVLSIVAMMTITLSASAMSYEQARNEALFLTDKMAYELNLTDAQYEAAYEINLDYLMGVTSVDDVYGTYWSRRNLDLSYILLDWQWKAYLAANYFYRPLYWDAGYWHFGVYARYPRRTFFYFDRPAVYVSYRGGHSWRMNGGRSYYLGRRDHFRAHRDNHFGMRDRWDRGDFRGGRNAHIGGRGSSTRVTVNNRNNNIGNNRNNNINNRNNTLRNNRNSTFNGIRGRENKASIGSFRNNNSTSRTIRNNNTTSRTIRNNNTTTRTFRNNNSTSRTFRNNSIKSNSSSNRSSSFSGSRNSSKSFSGSRGGSSSVKSSSFSGSRGGGSSVKSSSFSGSRGGGGFGGSRGGGSSRSRK